MSESERLYFMYERYRSSDIIINFVCISMYVNSYSRIEDETSFFFFFSAIQREGYYTKKYLTLMD